MSYIYNTEITNIDDKSLTIFRHYKIIDFDVKNCTEKLFTLIFFYYLTYLKIKIIRQSLSF